MHKSDEGTIIQNTALSDQADKPHTNISLRIKQTGFRTREIKDPRNIRTREHYTANLLTAEIAGIHCVTFPTAVSLHFLQSPTACSGSL